MTARSQLVEDLAREGIPAAVWQSPAHRWCADLRRRDGTDFVQLRDAEDQAAAEDWLLACAAETYPNCRAVRAARGRAA